MPSANPHSEEFVERVRQLYIVQGKTADATAKILRMTSRNAVVGLAMRRGWTKPHDNGRVVKRVKAVMKARKAAPRPSASNPPIVPPRVDTGAGEACGEPVSLMALAWHHCRWPISGIGESTLFCGERKLEGSPYCGKHFARAHVVKEKRSHHAGGGMRLERLGVRA